MPIKSQAQRRKFAELLVEGKIKPEVYERWNREAGSAKLPERVAPAKAGKAAKRKSAARPGRSRTKPKKSGSPQR